jgi:hypothetical protein
MIVGIGSPTAVELDASQSINSACGRGHKLRRNARTVSFLFASLKKFFPIALTCRQRVQDKVVQLESCLLAVCHVFQGDHFLRLAILDPLPGHLAFLRRLHCSVLGRGQLLAGRNLIGPALTIGDRPPYGETRTDLFIPPAPKNLQGFSLSFQTYRISLSDCETPHFQAVLTSS